MRRYETFIVAVSGGFDPIHQGHIAYLKEAKEIADTHNGILMVMLMPDDMLERKGKGHPFYDSYETRETILKAIKYVDVVVPQIDKGITCHESLAYYKPNIFAKGGDRDIDHIPQEELDVCSKYNITIITGVGGYDKPNSSSWLIKGAHKNGD